MPVILLKIKTKPQKRSSPLRGAAWEIHPVMKLEIAE
jgi:hypothetical protein